MCCAFILSQAVWGRVQPPRNVLKMCEHTLLYDMSSTFCQQETNKIINGLWIGSKISTLERLGISSFLKNGHEFHLWSYEKLDNLPSGTVQRDAREILPESEIWVYKNCEGAGSYSACSNTFRYKLLYEIGGWWCDTDVVCLKPFDFQTSYVFAAERSRNGASSPASCVIKVPAKSDVMKYCWETAAKADKESTKWGTIGPRLLAKSIFVNMLARCVQSVNCFCPVNWFQAEHDPVISEIPNLTNSYSVHLWHEMWRRKGLDKDATYSKDCLFERLKHDILPPATSC